MKVGDLVYTGRSSAKAGRLHSAIGLNRYGGKRSGAVAVSRCAAGSAMLLIEAIRLGLQQEQHHDEPINPWRHAAASTHARGHAPAQARAQDADLLRAGRTQAVSYTHLRAHETVLDLVCRLLLEKNNKT